MAENTNIEWTDASWNPFTGCTKISPGCKNCYMFQQWPRLKGMGVKGYEGEPDVPVFHEGRVNDPRHWKKPKLVFVCSMSDLFHESNTWAQLAAVFRTMATTPQHTYQVLTKRPGKMVRFAEKWAQYTSAYPTQIPAWPENVWAGVSVESQDYASRLNTLAKVPAKVRFVSAEPLLGPLDLRRWLICPGCQNWGIRTTCQRCGQRGHLVDWVIAGGESGPNARPMDIDWARNLRDQCHEAGIPFFLKQYGEWAPRQYGELLKLPKWNGTSRLGYFAPDGHFVLGGSHSSYQNYARIGKKAAGALLDGREHREFPTGM